VQPLQNLDEKQILFYYCGQVNF